MIITITRKAVLTFIALAISALGIIAIVAPSAPAHADVAAVKCARGTFSFTSDSHPKYALSVEGSSIKPSDMVEMHKYTDNGRQCWTFGANQLKYGRFCLGGARHASGDPYYTDLQLCSSATKIQPLVGIPGKEAFRWWGPQERVSSEHILRLKGNPAGASGGLFWVSAHSSDGTSPELFKLILH